MIPTFAMFGVTTIDQRNAELANSRGRRDSLESITMGKVNSSFPSGGHRGHNHHHHHHHQPQQQQQQQLPKLNTPNLIEEGLVGNHHRLAVVNNSRLPLNTKNSRDHVWEEFKLHDRLINQQAIGIVEPKHRRGSVTFDTNASDEVQPFKKLRLECTRPDKVYIESTADCKKMFPLPLFTVKDSRLPLPTATEMQTKFIGKGCLEAFQKKWECLEWYSDRVDDTVADQTAFVTEFFLRSLTSNPSEHLRKKIQQQDIKPIRAFTKVDAAAV